MKRNEWIIILVIIIIVAIVVSLITVNITGNTIKVSSARTGTEIYTKSEVDAKLRNLSLSSNYGCLVHRFSAAAAINGNQMCSENTRNKCLIGIASMAITYKSGINESGVIVPAGEIIYPPETFFRCDTPFSSLQGELNQIKNLTSTSSIEYQVICCN